MSASISSASLSPIQAAAIEARRPIVEAIALEETNAPINPQAADARVASGADSRPAPPAGQGQNVDQVA
jgi:hypothetical protein